MNRAVLILSIASLALGACARKAADDSATADNAAEPAPIAGENAYQPDAATEALTHPPATVPAEMQEMNARRGRILFTTLGCVICHQVNGVGGAAAAKLDAAPGDVANPIEFSARIWRGAPAMTALQEMELGYVIELEAQDIADLAAFVASPEEQKLMTYESVPDPLREWFINTPYWKEGDWEEFRANGERIPMDDPN
jgi:mono/diheme cytochrome c family protein